MCCELCCSHLIPPARAVAPSGFTLQFVCVHSLATYPRRNPTQRNRSNGRAGGMAAPIPVCHDQNDEGVGQNRPPNRLARQAAAPFCAGAAPALHRGELQARQEAKPALHRCEGKQPEAHWLIGWINVSMVQTAVYVCSNTD